MHIIVYMWVRVSGVRIEEFSIVVIQVLAKIHGHPGGGLHC